MSERVGLALLAEPAVEPVSLPEALAHLRADSAEDGTAVQLLIEAAREAVEKELGRALITQQWQLTQDCFPCGGEPLQLRYPPLISVESVKYLDSSGVLQTMSPSDYIVDMSADWGEIALAYGKSWPATLPQRNAVTVAFTVGYGDTPADVPSALRSALLLLVGDLYANREGSVTGTIVQNNPTIDALLNKYRVALMA